MKNIKIQCNYKKYNILIPDNVYKAIIYMNDLKRLKNRIRYAVKSGEYLRKKGDIFYRVNYISTTLNNLSYNVLFNSDKKIFEVFEMEV